MPEEIGHSLNYLSNTVKKKYGDLTIFSGKWNDTKLIKSNIYLSIAWSGWGKVSSARAATRLLSNKYEDKTIDALFFFGVAGAISPKLNQWDIVVSSELVQHDMDASPIYKKYVIPVLNKKFITSNYELLCWSLKTLKKSSSIGLLKDFGKVYSGLIATGDKFVNDASLVEELKKDFKDLLGVEMEGASVAQVATQEGIPWQILRVISDNANNTSSQDFGEFIKDYQHNSAELVRAIINNISSAPL